MNLSLRYAIYSAILSTEETATFMFLPSWNGSMITNPYSSLLTAYPHLCHKFGTIIANELACASPLSWISQETPLLQASWNLHIIAVWNAAAWLHLDKHDPTCNWLQNLACDIPEANWQLNNIASHPVSNAWHTETVLGLKEFEKLQSDKMQTTRCSHRPALGELAPLSHQSKPGLKKFLTGNPGPTQMVAAISRKAKQVLGQGSTSSGNSNLVEPNGAGIVNTIARAELSAIAAAITRDYTHIATDSLTSLHQFRKQLLYSEKHRHHVQGDILKILSNTIRNSQPHIFLHKVKSHAGIAGNECADALAKYQACHGNSLPAETTIRIAGPGGSPFFDISWLALEEVSQQNLALQPPNPALD